MVSRRGRGKQDQAISPDYDTRIVSLEAERMAPPRRHWPSSTTWPTVSTRTFPKTVLKEVGSILMKYHQSPDGFPKLNQAYANKVIKSLCEKASITSIVPVREYRGGNVIVRNLPKYELVSFHTARRSCITNLYRRGYSPNFLMTMSGHKSISSFQRYIKSSEEELAADFLKELKSHKDLL